MGNTSRGEAEFDRITRDNLIPVAAGLGILFVFLGFSHILFLPRHLAEPLAITSFITAILLAALWILLRRIRLPARWANPVTVGIALIVLLNALQHLYLADDPRQTTNVILLLLGFSFFLLDSRWVAASIVITWISWLVVASQMGHSSEWFHYRYAMLTATGLAILIHFTRLRTLNRFEELRRHDQEIRVELRNATLEAFHSEERFRKFAEAAFEGITIHEQGKILDVNKAAQEMFGYSYDELIGHSLLDMVAPESQPLVIEKMKSDDSQPYEVIGIKKDGTRFHLAVRSQGAFYQGRPVRLGVMSDITAQVQLEKALWDDLSRIAKVYLISRDLTEYTDLSSMLQATTDRVAEAFSGHSVIIYLLDLEAGRITHFVRGGPGADQAERIEFDELMEGLTGWALREQNAAYSSQKLPDSREEPRVQERRTKANVGDIVVVPLRGPGDLCGTITVVSKPGEDLTPTDMEWLLVLSNQISHSISNLRLVESLRLSEEKFFKAFHASPVPMMISSLEEGRLLEVNTSALIECGYKLEEMIGRTIDEVNIWASSQECKRFEQILQTQGSVRNFEAVYRQKSGETRVVLLSSDIVVFDGQPRLLSIALDITERKKVEMEREQLIQELDAFAHTVAHDLKNPLSPILTYADVLETRYEMLSDDLRHRALQSIGRSANRMSNIIDELLLLSKMRKSDVHVGPVDMAQVVKGAMHRLSYVVEESKAAIVLPDRWPEACGYSPWIEEVWANYLSNAIKYGGRPPHIQLGADPQPDGMVRFWIKDNGMGLTPEQQTKLFTPFTQVHQVKIEGYGLGLSIVQRIIERMGGTVGVESEPEKGSTFYFTLPISA